jgi:hypothetical protein
MGLLMSDTMLIDPTLDETMRLLDSRSELAYANDAARESYESRMRTTAPTCPRGIARMFWCGDQARPGRHVGPL